ncbi:MAG: hypothetical protein ABF246_03450 [Winogradskyella sp.]
MTILFFYLTALFFTVVPYLVFKNQFKSVLLFDASTSNLEPTKKIETKTKSTASKHMVSVEPEVLVSEVLETETNVVLETSLKYLEFINKFESYANTADISKLSPEFLQEFEAHKVKTQQAILAVTDTINKNYTSAA